MIAERDGAVVGLLMSARYVVPGGEQRNLRVIVHPDHRRQGIATRLVDTAFGQDDDGVARRAACLGSWPVGQAMLEARGFEATRRELTMLRDAGRPVLVPAPAIRLGSVDDDDAWTALHQDGYEEGPGFTPLTDDDLALYRSEPGFRLWFAAEENALVGLCHVRPFRDGETWVNSLVVSKARRGRGIGRALLVHALRVLADDGITRVHLGVREDNASAVTLYRSLGFEAIETETVWRCPARPLPPTSDRRR